MLTRISVKEELKVRESVGSLHEGTNNVDVGKELLIHMQDEAHGIKGRGDLWFIFGRWVNAVEMSLILMDVYLQTLCGLGMATVYFRCYCCYYCS